MFNLSRIMNAAWSEYRFQLSCGAEKSPVLWSKMLKRGWQQERDRIALLAERERRSDMARSNDPVTKRAYRIETIIVELENLKYCDGPIAMREATLRAELAELEATPKFLAVAA